MGSEISASEEDNSGSVLITPFCKTYLCKGFQLGQFLCVTPYEWDQEEDRPKVSSCGYQISYWHMVNAILFANYIKVPFILYQKLELLSTSNEDTIYTISILVRIVFLVIYINLHLILMLTVATKKKELAEFVTNYLDFFEDFEERFVPKNTTSPKVVLKCANFMGRWFVGIVGINLFVLLLPLWCTTSGPEYVSYLTLMDSNSDPISELVRKVSSVCVQILAHYNFLASASIVAFTRTGFHFPATVVMQELSYETCKISIDQLRKPRQMQQIFSKVQHLRKDCAELFSIFRTVGEYYLQLAFVYGIYTFLIYTGILNIVLE